MNDQRIDRLKIYRLEEDLSYDRLALRMNDAGVHISARALMLLLKGELKKRGPRDTTLYKIGRFLELVAAGKLPATTLPATPTRRPRPRRLKAATKRKKPRRAAA